MNAHQYRKKPVVIEAMQFRRRNNGPVPYPEWFDEAVSRNDIFVHNTGKWNNPILPAYCEIKTLEGVMRADEGDWIIRGVKGEMYPCKPDVFAITYEPPATQTDPVVEANRQLLLDRSRIGMVKYGVPLDSAGLSHAELTQHALEEALDLANYLQATLRKLRAEAPTTQTEDLAGAVWDGPNTASQVDPCMGLPSKR